MNAYILFFRKLRTAKNLQSLCNIFIEALISNHICEYISLEYYNFYQSQWDELDTSSKDFNKEGKKLFHKTFTNDKSEAYLKIFWIKGQPFTRKKYLLLKEYIYTFKICFNNHLLKEQVTVQQFQLKRYESLLNAIKEGIMIADLRGPMYFCNNAVMDMIGKKVSIKTFQDLHNTLFDDHAWQIVLTQIPHRERGEITTYKVDTVNLIGEKKTLAIRGIPLKEHEAMPALSLAVVRDITEEEIIKRNLENSQEEADQARKAERLFLANMSHEIRTPINAVIGMIHLLLQTHPSKEQIEYLQAIKFSADTLLNLITNILDISKIEAGEIHFEKTAFSLNRLLLTLQQFYQQQIRTQKSISIIVCTDDRIQQQIIGDSVRLHQVIANLITNACKFTEKGTVGINVELLEETEKTYTIEISIRDSGIGIAKENLTNIFDSFKQSSQQSYKKFGGTGLGLAIVKQLVEMQDGSIRIESTLGKGTTFFVTITFEKDTVPEINLENLLNETHIPNLQIDNEANNLAHLNILVAEDNELNQKLMSKLLETWKANAVFVENGQLALQELLKKQREFDVILMDIHMPLLDGYQTTEAIRNLADESLKNIPIIALTAAALVEEKQKALNIGMNDFLTKPFNPNQLFKLLSTYNKAESINSTLDQAPQSLIKMFDLTYLSNLCGNDINFISEILQNFLNENPKDLQQMQRLLDAQDVEGSTALLHKVKSTFSLVGFQYLNEKASLIEQSLRKEQFIQIHKETLQALINEIPTIYPILENWLKENN